MGEERKDKNILKKENIGYKNKKRVK